MQSVPSGSFAGIVAYSPLARGMLSGTVKAEDLGRLDFRNRVSYVKKAATRGAIASPRGFPCDVSHLSPGVQRL